MGGPGAARRPAGSEVWVRGRPTRCGPSLAARQPASPGCPAVRLAGSAEPGLPVETNIYKQKAFPSAWQTPSLQSCVSECGVLIAGHVGVTCRKAGVTRRKAGGDSALQGRPARRSPCPGAAFWEGRL